MGCNKTSHRLFLIPTIFMCFRFYAVAMAFVEIFLHVWAHKKNARNQNQNIYYRSPLHIITSQFCASCLHKRQMDKVSKLQEKRQKIWHFKNMMASIWWPQKKIHTDTIYNSRPNSSKLKSVLFCISDIFIARIKPIKKRFHQIVKNIALFMWIVIAVVQDDLYMF